MPNRSSVLERRAAEMEQLANVGVEAIRAEGARAPYYGSISSEEPWNSHFTLACPSCENTTMRPRTRLEEPPLATSCALFSSCIMLRSMRLAAAAGMRSASSAGLPGSGSMESAGEVVRSLGPASRQLINGDPNGKA